MQSYTCLGCIIIITLALNVNAQDCSNCNFYQCFEDKVQCGENGYLIGYGKYYCNRFSETQGLFDSAGQQWIGCVRQCLINFLKPSYDSYPNNPFNHDCNALKNAAFNSHVDCYLQCGFCNICQKNKQALYETYRLGDIFSSLAGDLVLGVMSPQPVPPVPYPPGASRPISVASSIISPPPPLNSGSTLLSKVLEQRKVHCADQLFSVSDYEIITELHSSLALIKHIFNDPHYVDNTNDQSVVELALARITSAIRESCCMETYAPALVDVLDSCLLHKMYIVVGNGQLKDSPHCRIASEILSSLFLYHSKKSVMIVAIPVAIKALSSSNQELVRSTTSYISLAAIHNGRLVAQYAVQLISNIISGNYPLVRVLPQIYPENREPFHAYLSPLFKLLGSPNTDTSEKLSLLQLASMIANNKPNLIIPHLSEFEEFLQSPTTCAAVLHIYLSLISMGQVNSLVSQLLPLKRAIRHNSPSQNTLTTMSKVIGHIGRTSPNMAALAIPDLIELCNKSSMQNLPVLLKEIEAVAEVYPQSVQHHLEIIKELSERQGSTYSAYKRIRALSGEDKKKSNGRINDPGSTEEILSYSGKTSRTKSAFLDSAESLQSKRSSRILPNDPTPNIGPTTIFNINESNTYAVPPRGIEEPDKNTNNFHKIKPDASVGNTRTPSFSKEKKQENPEKSENLISPTSYQLALLSTPITIGKDGRVRPMSISRNRPLSSALITEKDSTFTHPGYETTFPVANASPITTTASNLNVNSNLHLPPKAQRSSNSLSTVTKRENRLQSSDTIGRLSRTSSGKEDFDRGDVVKQFVGNRKSKIRRYITETNSKYPIPLKCTIEGTKSSKAKMRIHFICQVREHRYCLHCNNDSLFAFKTHIPAVWIHLMFLQSEATSIESSNRVLDQESEEFKTLAHCWECLPKDVTKGREFVTLVTSAFPSTKEQDIMLKELQEARYFDSFNFSAQSQKWTCFSCAHPEKVKSLIKSGNSNKPLLEGQLQEKRGKWKFLRRWQTKYFTLSSAALTCTDNTYDAIQTLTDKMMSPSIDLRKIRSIKSLSKGKQSRKSLPKAFEIFTEDQKSYVLKASDRSKAEEWFQSLQIAVAKAQRDRQK
ncbi:hypothetical protein FO519_006958 [Halicephalobus sp. NKZ332]|nr:hypothetical protein FO519_006958 [Halicephalobus sp. NKZ332]